MDNFNKKTAIVLFNLGGPDKPESVKPFLFNLFNDKAIISLPQPLRFLLAKLISKKRAPIAQEIYNNIGGKSPIYDLTSLQAHNLERELSFFGEFKTFIAMRYWKPFAADAIEQIKKYNPSQVILLPLYPQFSTTTSDSSIKEFVNQFDKEKIETKVVCCYPEDKSFILAHALLIQQTIMKNYDKNLEDFRFLFSAHGIPQNLVDKGDPYVFQVERTVEKVVDELARMLKVVKEKIDYQVCFQSKVGPLKWTTPSLDTEIKKVAIDKKIPVINPIAFVCDHSETLVELDIEYKEMADEAGVKDYLRVPALNSNGHFIESLKEICLNAAQNDKKDVICGQSEFRICPKKFKSCINKNEIAS